jgi:CheY-like chemotaxis protein
MESHAHPSDACDAAGRRAVLVVEDEILIRGTTADFLRDQGYVVIEAMNAMEAVAVFASRAPIDIVFTDWQMPGSMDGVMLARWIYRHHPGIPVLLTSGKGDVAAAAEFLPKEALVLKPYLVEDVADRIHVLLEAKGGLPT